MMTTSYFIAIPLGRGRVLWPGCKTLNLLEEIVIDLVAGKLRDRGLGFSCLNVCNFPSVSVVIVGELARWMVDLYDASVLSR